MKILLDTNVLLYAMDKSSKYNKISINILENEEYKLFVSTKNIAEIFAVSSKKKINKEIILKFVNEIVLEICTLLYPDSKSFEKFKQIISDNNIIGNKVYDMEIASIIITNKLDAIATFNHKDFKNINEISILKDCK